MKKQKRTIKPIINQGAGKQKRLPKKTTPGDPFFGMNGKSKFHN